MNPTIRVEPIDHSRAAVAERIHAVQMAAYSREAELIGATDFFPLSRTLENLRLSAGQFFGAYIGSGLVGAVGVESGARERIGISSLVVVPQWHRQGVGRSLLHSVLKLYGRSQLQVQTAARNAPALALYGQCGFVEAFRWSVGVPSLELVALIRSPPSAENVA